MEIKKSNYSYLLVVIGAFIIMLTYSVGTTGLSFLVEPITKEFGYTRSSFTLYYSIITLVGIFGMPATGRLIKKFGVRKISLLSGILGSIALVGFSKCNSLMSFYLVAAFFGFFRPSIVLGCTVLVDAWFSKKKGTVLGIVLAGSGLGGVIIGMIAPWSLSIYGWRITYIIFAMFQFILTLIAILLIKNTPNSIGLKKYGEADTVDINSPEIELTGILYKDALKMPQFYLLYFASVLVSLVGGFLQHLPAFYTGLGLDYLMTGSIVSILMLSVTFTKIIIGILNDKFGVKLVNIIIHMAYVVGFIILAFLETNYVMLVFTAVLLSFGFSSILVFSPLATRQVFGERDYSSIFGIIGTAVYVGSTLGAPAWGMVFDLTNSYNTGIIISAILILIVILIYSYAIKSK